MHSTLYAQTKRRHGDGPQRRQIHSITINGAILVSCSRIFRKFASLPFIHKDRQHEEKATIQH
jgi:hypothetical protein